MSEIRYGSGYTEEAMKVDFLGNLDALGMRESDFGKKFKDPISGHWCTFVGVKAVNPSKPMMFKVGSKMMKTSIRQMRRNLGYANTEQR